MEQGPDGVPKEQVMPFIYDSDIAEMTETQLLAEADSQAGQSVGSEIGSIINGYTEAQRLAILKLINQLMRMMGG